MKRNNQNYNKIEINILRLLNGIFKKIPYTNCNTWDKMKDFIPLKDDTYTPIIYDLWNLFTEDYKNLLLKYGWPGNIRELRNVIEHAFIIESSDMIQTSSLPTTLTTCIIFIPASLPILHKDQLHLFQS